MDELEEDEEGLEGADDGDVGAEILDGAAALPPPPEAGLAGLPDRRSVDGDLFSCAAAEAFGEGCRLGVVAAGAAGADARPAFGDGCRLGVAGLRVTAAPPSSWPLAAA